jgi:hypothetical protein
VHPAWNRAITCFSVCVCVCTRPQAALHGQADDFALFNVAQAVHDKLQGTQLAKMSTATLKRGTDTLVRVSNTDLGVTETISTLRFPEKAAEKSGGSVVLGSRRYFECFHVFTHVCTLCFVYACVVQVHTPSYTCTDLRLYWHRKLSTWKCGFIFPDAHATFYPHVLLLVEKVNLFSSATYSVYRKVLHISDCVCAVCLSRVTGWDGLHPRSWAPHQLIQP